MPPHSSYLALAPRSQDVIAELVRQTDRPAEEVGKVYALQLVELDAYATVKTFIPVIAKRRARDILSHH